MLDTTDPDENSDPSSNRLHGQYAPQPPFDHHHQPTSGYYQAPMSVSSGHQEYQVPPTSQPASGIGVIGQFSDVGEVIDPNDPMLDADPFGLSASMHYPTSYSFEQAPHR